MIYVIDLFAQEPGISQSTIYQKYATLDYGYISKEVHKLLDERLRS